MRAEQDAHQIIHFQEEVRGMGRLGTLHGDGVGQGQEELVESRDAGGIGGADPGGRRLGALAPGAVPDQLPGPAVQRHAEVLQDGGGKRVLATLVVLYSLAGDDPVSPSLGAAVGCVLDRLYNKVNWIRLATRLICDNFCVFS